MTLARVVYLSAMLCGFALVGAAHGADARLIRTQGTVSPDFGALAEAKAGDRFQLSQDAVVVVIHYASCEEMHLQGGRIQIMPSGIRQSGGGILFRQKGNCPGSVDLANTDAKGAVVLMRGDNEGGVSISTSGPRPRFLVTGAAGGASELRILDGDETLVVLPISEGSAAWPPDAAPLVSGEEYDFVIPLGGDRFEGGKLRVAQNGPGLIILQ